jgi:cytochrome bd-type quinol oxidase subunit 1
MLPSPPARRVIHSPKKSDLYVQSTTDAAGSGMSQLDLARLQFAMTSIYHFLFVPVTIGLGFLTALLQPAWHRTGLADHLRLSFSLFQVGGGKNDQTPTKIIEIPHLLSLLGLDQVQSQYQAQFGPATMSPMSSSSTGRCG